MMYAESYRAKRKVQNADLEFIAQQKLRSGKLKHLR